MNNSKGLYWLVAVNLIISIVTLVLLYQHAQVAVEIGESDAFFSSEYSTFDAAATGDQENLVDDSTTQ